MLIHLRQTDAEPLFIEMMDWNHPYECFDFRDRVYGVLGFVADGAEYLSLVDYDCSAEELFLSILKVLGFCMDCTLHRFITRTNILARRIGLDLVKCGEVSKAFAKSTGFGFFDLDANPRHNAPGFPHAFSVMGEMESQVQLKRTSQMLQKYQRFQTHPGGKGEVIAKVKLLPGDWLIFPLSR